MAMTLKEAYAKAQEGMDHASDHAGVEWQTEALKMVLKTCWLMPTFICDNVWEQGLEEGDSPRALGPVMRQAARLGFCKKTNQLQPSVRSNGSGKPVWKSLIYDSPDS